MTDTPTPEAVERLAERLAELDARTGSPAAYEGAKMLRALAAERDVLRENRDKLNHAYREGRMKGREEALAASGAVAEAMREKAADLCQWHSNRLVAAILRLPIPPDAAAALAEHDKRVLNREREIIAYEIAEMAEHDAEERNWRDGAKQARRIAAAILARKEEE